ncbi:MAG: hypothetical protein AAF682_32430, partial [Planctomycetota bacterium]
PADARDLARETMRRAGGAAPTPRPAVAPARRRRVAVLAAAAGFAAALLAGAVRPELSLTDGALAFSLRLPGAAVEPRAEAEPADRLTGLTRRVEELLARGLEDQRAELDAHELAAEERGLRLAAALSEARTEDRTLLLSLIDTLSRSAAREDQRTREAMVELASYVARSDDVPNR